MLEGISNIVLVTVTLGVGLGTVVSIVLFFVALPVRFALGKEDREEKQEKEQDLQKLVEEKVQQEREAVAEIVKANAVVTASGLAIEDGPLLQKILDEYNAAVKAYGFTDDKSKQALLERLMLTHGLKWNIETNKFERCRGNDTVWGKG